MTVCRVCFEAAVSLMERCSMCAGRQTYRVSAARKAGAPENSSFAEQADRRWLVVQSEDSEILQFCKALSSAREEKQHL